MIYSSLIYFLVVIVILATSEPLESSLVPGYQALLTFTIKMLFFWQTIRFFQRRLNALRSSEYFSLERGLSVLALILFSLDVYLLDLKYYLGLVPFSKQVPALVDLAGLAVFLLYLVVLWLQLKSSYEKVFRVRQAAMIFILNKLRFCVALILPWLVVNLLHDLLLVAPGRGVRSFMESAWGEPLFLLMMIAAAVIWFPPLLVRMLGCTVMPAGEERSSIEQFCRSKRVKFREVLLWPLFEGRVLTAGVIGLLGRYRYLLITPALLEALSQEELEAVVAHETGHVKKHHLLLYLLLFIGFAAILQLCVQPLLYLMLRTRLFYQLLFGYEGDIASLVTVLTGGPVVVMALLYFRYVFGFFMRNFERQADQYALQVMGSAAPLVSVFKKIAQLSGSGADKPCWHHFSIGQRIEHLLRCQSDNGRMKDHDLKVYGSLTVYFFAVAFSFVGAVQIGALLMPPSPGQKIAEEVITEKIARDPSNPLWHQFHGDLLIARQQYDEAIGAFERSLSLDPDNPETLNNLAWLLLTSEKISLLDPARALELAKIAADIQARSHILDTLAEAYWQNGMVGLAVETEELAIEKARGNKGYYRDQLEKFSSDNKS